MTNQSEILLKEWSAKVVGMLNAEYALKSEKSKHLEEMTPERSRELHELSGELMARALK